MTEEQKDLFLKTLGEAFLEYYYDKSEDDKYVIDDQVMIKMMQVLKYCQSLEESGKAKIECFIRKPKNEHGVISVRFPSDLILDRESKTLQNFIDTISICDALNINGTGLEDGSFLIDFFVDKLFVKRQG